MMIKRLRTRNSTHSFVLGVALPAVALSVALSAAVFVSACASKSTMRSSKVVGEMSPVGSDSAGSGITVLRPYREKTLPNGLKVLFLEDPSLPSLSMNLLIKTGASRDPEGQSGLANLVAELLDQGTKKRDALQVADDLARIGAQFEASTTYDFANLSISGLSFSGHELLQHFYDIATSPSFPNQEIDRMKKRIMGQIERGLDNASFVADLGTLKALYPKHPYGRAVTGTASDLQAITKKHIVQHYLKFFRPNNAILAVVGKYDENFERKVESMFSAWSKREMSTMTALPEPEESKAIKLRVIDKAGLTQAQVRIVGLGIERQDDDFLKLRVANTILGGAFTSRLNNRIRKELGLTYGISSSYDPRIQKGPFEIESFTKLESLPQLVKETLAMYRQFIEKGVTGEEVDRAKGYLKGIFPQAIQTSERLAYNLLVLRFYGIPDRYLTNYVRDLDSISVGDINRAIKRHMKPDGLSIVVHAPKAATQELTSLANSVEVITVDQVR